ncbi:hypothetical protein G7046_g9305 [Stylonectria norvegica]|nr:hypothetical protein G7046_g9305 [Stylonectria norvegica]
MPVSMRKTIKAISKKRGGVVNALHVKSRDSMRLHKAAVRDARIETMAVARKKQEQPLIARVSFFQQALRLMEGGTAPSLDELHIMINSFVHQHDEEYSEVKKTRRPGRPSSVKEDLLKNRINALESEYQKGFIIPDLLAHETVSALHLWEGSWSYLSQMKWIKVMAGGDARPIAFPAGGIN